MSIGTVCCREVYLAGRDETAAQAAARMHENKVGTLLVLDRDRRPVGILTDRDLVMRVMARKLDPAGIRVEQAMTPNPWTVSEASPIEHVLERMHRLGVRRMPVVDDAGALVGLVSIDDVLPVLARELADLSKVLEPTTGAVRPAIAGVRRRLSLSGLERALGDPEC